MGAKRPGAGSTALGAGRAKPRAVVKGGQVVAHRMLPLSLTFDHRVVNGGEAAGFLAAMSASPADPTVPFPQASIQCNAWSLANSGTTTLRREIRSTRADAMFHRSYA